MSQKSLTPVLVVRQNTRWRDTVDQNVGQIHAGKGAAPGLIGEGRRSDSNRCRSSSDPEPGALLLPDDGEAGVARKLLRSQFDRMAARDLPCVNPDVGVKLSNFAKVRFSKSLIYRRHVFPVPE